jgi:hypothetical protein
MMRAMFHALDQWAFANLSAAEYAKLQPNRDAMKAAEARLEAGDSRASHDIAAGTSLMMFVVAKRMPDADLRLLYSRLP